MACFHAGPRAKQDNGEIPLAQVLALVDDLFFQAKILETAKHAGVEMKICRTGAALVETAGRENPRLVIIDLNARQGAIEAIERLSSNGTAPIIGFLSHVQRDLAARAQAAGCSEVMPRSAFTQNLPRILAQAKSE
jgi:CheY-like chemotaxis protein